MGPYSGRQEPSGGHFGAADFTSGNSRASFTPCAEMSVFCTRSARAQKIKLFSTVCVLFTPDIMCRLLLCTVFCTHGVKKKQLGGYLHTNK